MIALGSWGSTVVMALGVAFWLWGSWPLLGRASVLRQLHGLSVADGLGSALIVVGLLLRRPPEWPLLVLALGSLLVWNTLLSAVLASSAHGARRPEASVAPLERPPDPHG
ncbi:monovalent cation/H(+) antiporter subunit G [Vulcanococcus limneticus]|uniref:monovalent cation/H(+) antiporter subunit G n=1 Tax=Vulcanococcus limneticus TaxID=2170428 RepID=UPI00398BE1BE